MSFQSIEEIQIVSPMYFTKHLHITGIYPVNNLSQQMSVSHWTGR